MNDLSRLLHEAVDHVEPRPALDDIRGRIAAGKEPAMSRRWIAPLAGAAAVAAIVGGFFVLHGGDDRSTTPPITSHSPAPTPTPAPPQTPTTAAPTPTPTPTAGSDPGPAFFVGDTSAGPRLYREYEPGLAGNPLVAVQRAVSGGAQDPDYRTLWPAHAAEVFQEVQLDPRGLITVVLADDSLSTRPVSMPEAQARMALQQVVYTAEAAFRGGAEPRVVPTALPVRFELPGNRPVASVLGVDTARPIVAGSPLKTLSHVVLDSPAEDQTAGGKTLVISGEANSFEANVVIRVQRYEGTHIAVQEPTTAQGWQGDDLFPFSYALDLSKLSPGKWTVMAMTDDPSGQGKSFTDDKVIVVR